LRFKFNLHQYTTSWKFGSGNRWSKFQNQRKVGLYTLLTPPDP
jgi:hypothetical protein